MIRYQRGDKAKEGYYLNLSNGELVHPDKDGRIPATAEGKFLRFPSLIAIVAAPFVGLVYVVFLPLTGIIAAFAVIGLKVRSLGKARAVKQVSTQ